MSFKTKCAVAFTAPERTECRRGMGKVRSVLGVVAAGGILSMVMSTGVVGAAVAKAQDVFVTNDDAHPLPVAGTVSVGNLPATQPVSGTVRVDNLPATQQVSGTVDVRNFPADLPINTVLLFNTALATGDDVGADVSVYRTVRLRLKTTGCSNQTIRVYDQSTNITWEEFNIGDDFGYGSEVQKVYEVLGTHLQVYAYTEYGNNSGCIVWASAWGRSN